MEITKGTYGYVVRVTQSIDDTVQVAFNYCNLIYKTLNEAREAESCCRKDFPSFIADQGSVICYKVSIERFWFSESWFEDDSKND